MLPPMTTGWEDAVAAVEGGTAVTDAAAVLVASDDRRRAPVVPRRRHPVLGRAWPTSGRGGYHRRPFLGRRASSGWGSRASRSATVPAASSSATPLPSRSRWPGRHLGHRSRGAHRRGDRPGAPSGRRRPLRRRVHQRAPPPGVGPGPGDLRRGSAPPRRDGRRPHPGRPAPRDGDGEALRLQLDGERPLQGRRHGRRAGAARGVPPSLQAGRRRGRGLRDERLQRGQRRVVRRERPVAHRHRCGSSGASTASSSATGSSGCATPPRR